LIEASDRFSKPSSKVVAGRVWRSDPRPDFRLFLDLTFNVLAHGSSSAWTRHHATPPLADTPRKLFVNLKTAKELGITIPPSVLARADEAIE